MKQYEIMTIYKIGLGDQGAKNLSAKVKELIDSMGVELTILERQNHYLNEEIKEVKQDAKNKINAVDKLNNAELQQFFTERYK